jgi:urocanate hydratase
VGDWATWPEFRRLEDLGLTMYGQMTAGSWIYIGTQGILQGTYETFAAVAEKHFGGTLAGTLTVTGGCGGMGGAQPLAVTMNEGTCLIIDVDGSRLKRRVSKRYLDVIADNLEQAVAMAVKAKSEKQAISIGLVGNSATVLPQLFAMGVPIDIVTDQTSAHDPLFYIPEGIDINNARDEADRNPVDFAKRAKESMAKHVEAMVNFQDKGAVVFDYAMKRVKVVTSAPLNFLDLSRHTSVHFSAKGKGRFAGSHFQEIHAISHALIKQFLISFPIINIFTVGSRWLKIELNLRDFLHVSVGSVMANATRQVWHLTI